MGLFFFKFNSTNIVLFFHLHYFFPHLHIFIGMGKCICNNCGIEFEKRNSEINRNERLGRPNFCSRYCVGKNNSKNLGDHLGNYKQIMGYKRYGDEFTKFRYHYRNITKRNFVVNVTIEDLKDQWEIQNGVCPYTGIQLILSSYSKINKNPIYSASLDRRDSGRGYIKGNIVWVSRVANWMKNDMTEEMVMEFIDLLVENKKESRRTL